MPNDWMISLLLFAALVLVLSLYGLTASGHFPRSHRSLALSTGAGSAILYLSIVIAVACALAGVLAAAGSLPWYAAVIGGGGAILSAPLVLQNFSDRFVNGRAALIVLTAAAAVLALLLLRISGGPLVP
jgi:hypothetical protein